MEHKNIYRFTGQMMFSVDFSCIHAIQYITVTVSQAFVQSICNFFRVRAIFRGMFLTFSQLGVSTSVKLRHSFLPSVHAFNDSHVYLAEREHVLILSNLHIEVWMK